MSNFSFLTAKWPALANLGEMAESNLHHDSNTTLFKLRIFGETTSKIIIANENLKEPLDNRQENREILLKKEDIIPDDILNIFRKLRRIGNKAAHDGYESLQEAQTNLHLAFNLGTWLMQVYGDWSFQPEPYEEPAPQLNVDHDALTKLLEEKDRNHFSEIEKLTDELDQLRLIQQSNEVLQARRKRSQQALNSLLDEKQTRLQIIDRQLETAGWEVDSDVLTYANGTRPEHGKNLAIAEWPTTGRGSADYALFVGLKFVGIIEAKRRSKDVVSDLRQAKLDAAKLIQRASEEYLGPWGDYKVPFVFATNGRPYFKQLETKSGIWFQDVRINTNMERPLQSWYSPQGLIDLLKQDHGQALKKLSEEPLGYLNLRDYQEKAIKAVETAIANNQRAILLAMATGTGKTKTAIALIHRLLRADRFKRILFLVDRSALGEQASKNFKEFMLDGLIKFWDAYNVLDLDSKEKRAQSNTRVHIATVQGMVKRILFTNDPLDIPKVDEYDCIIIDEAHRGYILDKLMNEADFEFRDQLDYVSKYRKVIEYFDAVKIGLTATPAIHTTEIFGNPVFTYSYREAVVEGRLIDYVTPHEYKTFLKKNGIKWGKGESVEVFNSETGDIEKIEELSDEVHLDVDKFNREVITESFDRLVLSNVVEHLDPFGQKKTLVFASNDDHADRVVKILKEQLEDKWGEVDAETVMKITGSIKDPKEAIGKFKNEKLPNIVVTVDLLTTGIDVPKICNLVFLRRVKSRILFEQMIGRATRPCDEIGKEYFEVFDPVGLFDVLEKVNTMKPIVADPSLTISDLITEMSKITNEERQKKQIDDLVARLQRKKRNISNEALDELKSLTGHKTVEELIDWVRKTPYANVAQELSQNTRFLLFVTESWGTTKKPYISNHEDKDLEHSRGYGKGERPEDYLDEFSTFLRDHMNEIPALVLVCTKPSELTKEDLKTIHQKLDEHGFRENDLKTACYEMNNIAANTISIIRQRILGDALISHEERVEKAMKKIYQSQKWTPIQRRWLENIERRLKKEQVLGPDATVVFEAEPFKGDGGFKRAEKIFEGQTQSILTQVNEQLYA